MRIARTLLASVTALLLAACADDGPEAPPVPLVAGEPEPPAADPGPRAIGRCDARFISVEPRSVTVEGDELVVKGGCALCWTGVLLESRPPQVQTYLSGGTCEGAVRFNLAPLRALRDPTLTVNVGASSASY